MARLLSTFMPRYGVSPWEGHARGARVGERARFQGERRADVVVIGAGLTGTLTALLLARAGAKVIVLEAQRVGGGATADSPGVIAPRPGLRFTELHERHGLRAARHVWEQTRAAALELAALLRRLRVRCDLEKVDRLEAAFDDSSAARLEREYRALREAGVEVSWSDGTRVRGHVGSADAVAAVRLSGAGLADPYRAALGVARHAERAGVRIFEQSPVVTLRPGAREIAAETAAGRVIAGHAVVATGGATGLHHQLARHLTETEAYGVLLDSLPASARRSLAPSSAYIVDTASPPHGWRWHRTDALLFWGAAERPVPQKAREGALVQRGGRLMYELSLVYPHVSGLQPELVWAMRLRRSSDGLPLVGPHRNYPRQLFAFAVDSSLADSYLAARLLVRRWLDTPDKMDELFGFVH